MVKHNYSIDGDSASRRTSFWDKLLRFFGSFDYVQLIALAFLIGIGLLFIRSTGIQVGTPWAMAHFTKQLQWVGAGTVLYIIASLVNYRAESFRAGVVLFYLVMMLALALVLKLGIKVNGAVSWFDIGGGIRLQPSELSKLAVILLLAVMFSTRVFNVNRPGCVTLAMAATALPFGLILLEPDFGSAIILLPVFLAVVFCAGLKWRYIITLAVIVLIAGSAVIANEATQFRPLLKEYQRNRIRVFLDPEIDLMNSGYNQYQARLAVGSGGLTGKGIGQGTQNALGFLPQTIANNDFIFSVIAEEIGFAGCFLLIVGYLALFYSILRSAFLSADAFGRYIGVGVAAMLFTHCFINIGMSVGLCPVTGVPLPFISYGGSFMLMGMAALGVMQSVYRYRAR